jgi:tetratricopeptide (TPR) repeat protein
MRETLEKDPSDWDTRRSLAFFLYDLGSYEEAADIIWSADEIPSIDIELAFAARILSKARPRRAIRLLTSLLEHNRGKAVQNMGLANALLHHGMVLQAARFYGAALEADASLVNPDLEHFMLWTDDEETIWGGFKERQPDLGELPWMKRDPMEALELTSKISLHTTPIRLPRLEKTQAEQLVNPLYQQKAERGAPPTPPPSVTIPMDRVDPKYRLYDSQLGAETGPPTRPSTPAAPQRELAKPNFGAAPPPGKP